MPVPFETHLRELEPLVAEAKAGGYAQTRIDCRFVQVIDYRHFGDREDVVAEIIASADRDIGWLGDGRLILVGIVGAARIRDRGDPVPWLAPLSIYPLPAEDVADLILGAIDVRVHLNTELLALEFAKRGLSLEFMRDPASRVHFLHAQRGYLGVRVPAYVREQMLYELITVPSLVRLVDWVIGSGLPAEWTRRGEAPVDRLGR